VARFWVATEIVSWRSLSKQLEDIAGRPPRNEMASSLRLGQLDARPLAPSAVTLGPSDVSVISAAATVNVELGSTSAVSLSNSGEVQS